MSLYDEGEMLYIHEKYEDAIEYFKQSFEYEEEDKNSALNYIGCCYIYLEKYDAAIEAFNEVLESELWERPLFNKGRVYLNLGNNSEALACFNRALMVNPKESDVYYYLGVYYDKIRDYNTSRDYYEKAIEIKDTVPEYHLNLSVACFRNGDFNKALEEANISISLDDSSSNADAFFNKAYILYRLKRYEDALEAYLKVVDMRPDDVEAMNLIAKCYGRLKQYDKSLQWVNEALRIDSDNKEAIEHKRVLEGTAFRA